MSSEGAAPPPAAVNISMNPTQDLARELYVDLCARIYSGTSATKPKPMDVAKLSFNLAVNFAAANFEFNPVARAAREAKEKAGVNLLDVEIDFASLGKAE